MSAIISASKTQCYWQIDWRIAQSMSMLLMNTAMSVYFNTTMNMTLVIRIGFWQNYVRAYLYIDIVHNTIATF